MTRTKNEIAREVHSKHLLYFEVCDALIEALWREEQGKQQDREELAERLEYPARCFYGEQYGDTPLEPEMVTFAARFAACQITGYKTEEESIGDALTPANEAGTRREETT